MSVEDFQNHAIRSSAENRKFHAMCKDFEKQCEWAGGNMGAEDWKRLFLAAHFGQRVVPNPFGGSFVVMNNKRSSELSVSKMAELISQMTAFGNERGVQWSDPEWQREMREEKAAA